MEPLKINDEGSTMNFPQIQLTQDVASSSSSQPPPPPHPSSSLFPATLQHASSSSASPAAPPAPAPPPPRLPEHLMHKNRLQEFAQRSNIALPMYQTTNEGSPHAPRFRSTVWVDGMSYTSQVTFSQRKAAEQDVARLALESLSKRIKDEGCPLVCENTLFSKSILNEYATKLNVERPTYNTVQLEGLLPLFQSSVVFNGTKYTGDTARNKKEAEQLAARTAILSILDGSSSGTLYEIIKSKSRIYAAVKPNKSQCIDASTVSAIATKGHASDTLDHKDKEVASLVAANNNETKIEPPVSSKMLSSCQEFRMPEYVTSAEATKLPIISLQPGGSEQDQQAIGNGSSAKKRRKNKKKANKKSRLESPLPIAAVPCSVSQ